ncbi:MAG: type 4a pilus biogenesis protein PilO [Armatimonadota bacterium]
MGRIPPIAVIAIGLVVVIGAGVAMFFFLHKPAYAELGELQEEYERTKGIADRLDDATAERDRVAAQWEEYKAELDELRAERSIPISFGHPAGAMVTLWYEYREYLPPLIEDWVESTGCTIESGASFPAPAMTPPSVPPSGFLQVPPQSITLTVSGSLSDIERLYRSLERFPRVVTVSQLVLEAADDTGNLLRSQVPMKFYLLVEAPESMLGGGGGGAAAGGGGMGMGPEGMGMGPGGMPPGEMGPADMGAGGMPEGPMPPGAGAPGEVGAGDVGPEGP